MSVVTEGPRIRVEGVAGVEEAEVIVAHLEAVPGAPVDLSGASHVHASVLQVLLAYRPDGPGPDPGSPLAEALAAAGLGPIPRRDAA